MPSLCPVRSHRGSDTRAADLFLTMRTKMSDEEIKRKRREYDAAKYAANPEKMRAASAASRQRNIDKRRKYDTDRYPEFREVIRESARRRYAANPEKGKKRTSAYYMANIAICKAKDAIYRAKNAERIRLRKAAYRAANKEKIRLYDAAKYAASRPTMLKAQAKRRAKNPQRVSQSNHTRRAKKRNAVIGDLAVIARWEVKWRRKRKVACHWCGTIVSGRDGTLDHIIPLVPRGLDGGSHSIENLCISCASCNAKKNTKPLHEWNAQLVSPVLL